VKKQKWNRTVSNAETKIPLRLLFRRIAAPGGLQEFGDGLEKTRLATFSEYHSVDVATIALRIFKAEFSCKNHFHRLASNSEVGTGHLRWVAIIPSEKFNLTSNSPKNSLEAFQRQTWFADAWDEM
jgi:hypothetical protein